MLQGYKNYSISSKSMQIILRANSKLDFILGLCIKDMYDSSLHELWKRYDAIVLAWFMNTVSKLLINNVIYASNAHEI